MPEIVRGAEHLTFINTFRCAPKNQTEVVQINIDIIERVASTFPGFISATVHRSTVAHGSSITSSGSPRRRWLRCNAPRCSRRSPAGSTA